MLLLAVVPIVSGTDPSINVSGIYAAARAAAQLRPAIELLSEEDLFVASREQRVMDCGSDLRCVAARLRGLNADLGLVVVLSRLDEGLLIDLRLIQTEDARLIASEGSTYTTSEGPLLGAITKRIARLFEEARYGRAGKLRIGVTPPNARLWVDGAPAEAESIVAPGEHAVLAEADGFVSAEQRVTVVEGESAQVTLALEEQTSVLASWWLWTLVGAAVVGGIVAGVVVATRPDDRYCVMRAPDASCD